MRRLARSGQSSWGRGSSRSRGSPVEEVAALVRPLVTRDNESSLILRLPEFIVTDGGPHGLGLSVGRRRGAAHARAPRRRALRRDARSPAPRLGPSCAISAPPAPPACRRRSGFATSTHEWTATLARGRIIYAAYRRRWGDGRFGGARSPGSLQRKVRRVILDVRLNGGGDNTTYGPLLGALPRPRRSTGAGSSSSSPGRVTFSADGQLRGRGEGVDARADRRRARRREPAQLRRLGRGRASPRSAGRSTSRPSTSRCSAARTSARSSEPDVRVVASAADHFAGRDPAAREGAGASLAETTA